MRLAFIGLLLIAGVAYSAQVQISHPRGGSGGLAGSTGSTDNALLRADGTGGATVQSSTVTLGDTGALVNEVTADVIAFQAKSFSGGSAYLISLFRGSDNSNVFTVDKNGTIVSAGDLTTNNIFSFDGKARIAFGQDSSSPQFLFTMRDNSTARTSIGTFQAQKATQIGLTVTGYTSQSANLQEWTSVTPTTLAKVTPAGAFVFVGKTSDPCADTTGFPADSTWMNTTNHVLCTCVSGASKRASDGSTSCF